MLTRYFLPNHESVSDEMTSAEMEEMFANEKGAFIMAHNGWVMGDDPLRNFALEGRAEVSFDWEFGIFVTRPN